MDSLTDGINLRFLMAISIFCAETTSFLVAIRSDPRKSSNQGNQGKSNRFEKPDFPINRGMEMLKMGLIAEPSPWKKKRALFGVKNLKIHISWIVQTTFSSPRKI